MPQENNDNQPYDCIDCDERIPQARVHLGFKKRCVHCQNEYEKQRGRKVR
ncbi:MAG: TraR/DksA C4-type zinc finger protein [Gammaproteobacteria bacterium]|nr:TraR/DksA C4-type zinc finger protein [Gammaproteobacteria bacterium]